MPKTDPSANIADYAPVADRITLFYSRYPMGRIVTDLVTHAETHVVFKAMVYRSIDEREPAATGWAAERVGDGDINTVACIENTETSAVGRALANLGLTASRSRPSLEEIEKAARVRLADAIARIPAQVDVPPAVSSKPASPLAVTPSRSRVAERRPVSLRMVRERQVAPFDPKLQRLADRVTDVFGLIEEAERAGLAGDHVRKLRERLHDRSVAPSIVEHAERTLRKWLADRASALLLGVGAIPAAERADGGVST